MRTGRGSVAQNSAVALVASIAAYVLTFFASVIVARTLGPTGKGILQLVVLTQTLLVTVSNLGLAPANSFLIAKRQYSFPEVAWHAGWLAVGLGLLTFVLTVIVSQVLPASVVQPEQRIYIIFAGSLVPFALLTSFFNGVLQGAGLIIWLSALSLAQAVIYAVATFLLLFVLNLGVAGGLAAFGCMTVFTSLLTGVVVWWQVRVKGWQDAPALEPSDAAGGSTAKPDPRTAGKRRRWNPALVRSASHFGSRAYLASVVSFLNLRSDQFLVSYLAGAGSLGQYSVAVTVAELLLFFPRSLSTALLPRITGAKLEDAGHMAASASRHTIAASLLGLLGLIPLALLIPVIFGPAYQPAVIPCLLLAPGVAVFSLAPVLSTYFSGQLGRPLIASLLAALSLVLDLILVWFMVPVWKETGAALASTIAYFVTVLIMVTLFLRLSRCRPREMLAFRRDDFLAYRDLVSSAVKRVQSMAR